jgi:hypothetical protein
MTKRLHQQTASLPNLTKPFYEKTTLLLHIAKICCLLVNSFQPKLKNVKLLTNENFYSVSGNSVLTFSDYYCFRRIRQV